jgi:hypothetical protein
MRRTLAEASQVPPACPELVILSGADPGALHRAASEDLDITPRAAALLAPFPKGGGRRTVEARLAAGRLVLLEPRVLLTIRGGAPTGRGEPRREAPFAPNVPPITQTHYLEIELIDANDKPVAGERCRVVLPDGSVREQYVGTNGQIRLDKVPPGTCTISFPDIGGRPSQTTSAAGAQSHA